MHCSVLVLHNAMSGMLGAQCAPARLEKPSLCVIYVIHFVHYPFVLELISMHVSDKGLHVESAQGCSPPSDFTDITD